MDRDRDLGRFVFAAAFAAVGLIHFLSPRVFVDHLPADIPGRLPIVYATGALELLLAAAVVLAPPGQRRRVGLITATYLVAVFPANIYVALAGVPVYPAPWLAWARLPLQPLFIWWAIRSTSPHA